MHKPINIYLIRHIIIRTTIKKQRIQYILYNKCIICLTKEHSNLSEMPRKYFILYILNSSLPSLQCFIINYQHTFTNFISFLLVPYCTTFSDINLIGFHVCCNKCWSNKISVIIFITFGSLNVLQTVNKYLFRSSQSECQVPTRQKGYRYGRKSSKKSSKTGRIESFI